MKNKVLALGVRLVAALAAVLLLAGCNGVGSWMRGSDDPKAQEDVASTHIAVVAVAPWDDVVEVLQPSFDLTTSKALELVMPTTTSETDKSASLRSFYFKLGLYQGKTMTGSDLSSNGDTNKTATLPDVTGQEFTRKQDPVLQYLTAAGLYQEAQILSNYLSHWPNREGYKAFFVRVQFTLLPLRRNLPYDAFLTLSFYDGGDGAKQPCCPDLSGSESPTNSPTFVTKDLKDRSAPVVIPLMLADQLETTLQTRAQQSQRGYDIGADLGFPGSDGGLSAGFAKSDAAYKEALAQVRNSLMSVGRINASTLRIRLGAYSLGDNKYSLVPRSQYLNFLVLVPETKNVLNTGQGNKTIFRKIDIISHASFINTSTGACADRRTEERIDTLTNEALSDILPKEILDWLKMEQQNNLYKEFYNAVWETALINRFDCFTQAVNKVVEIYQEKQKSGTSQEKKRERIIYSEPDYQHGWIRATQLMVGAKDAFDSFIVSYEHDDTNVYKKYKDKKKKQQEKQTVLLIDDGQHLSCQLPVSFGQDQGLNGILSPNCDKSTGKLAKSTSKSNILEKENRKQPSVAYLIFNTAAKKEACISSEKISFAKDGSGTAMFPSLSNFGLGESLLRSNISLTVNCEDNNKLYPCLYRRVSASSSTTADKKLKIAANVDTISYGNKEAKLALEVTLADNTEKAVLEIKGADLQPTQNDLNGVVKVKGLRELEVLKKGITYIALTNLSAKKKVTVTPRVDGQLASLPLEFSVEEIKEEAASAAAGNGAKAKTTKK